MSTKRLLQLVLLAAVFSLSEQQGAFSPCTRRLQTLQNGGVFGTFDRTYARYTRNMECEWVIRAPRNQVPQVRLDLYDVQETPGCTKDAIVIYNGEFSSDPVLRRVCGRSRAPMVVRGTQENMLIRFESDDDGIQGWGFKGTAATVNGEREEPVAVPATLEPPPGTPGPPETGTPAPPTVAPTPMPDRPVLPSVNPDGCRPNKVLVYANDSPLAISPTNRGNILCSWMLSTRQNMMDKVMTIGIYRTASRSDCRTDYIMVNDGVAAPTRFCFDSNGLQILKSNHSSVNVTYHSLRGNQRFMVYFREDTGVVQPRPATPTRPERPEQPERPERPERPEQPEERPEQPDERPERPDVDARPPSRPNNLSPAIPGGCGGLVEGPGRLWRTSPTRGQNILCTWVVRSSRPENSILAMTLYTRADSSDCDENHVNVYDGDVSSGDFSSARRIGRVCFGANDRLLLNSSSDTATLVYESNYGSQFMADIVEANPPPNRGSAGVGPIRPILPGVVDRPTRPPPGVLPPTKPSPESSQPGCMGELVQSGHGRYRSAPADSEPQTRRCQWILNALNDTRGDISVHISMYPIENAARGTNYITVRTDSSAEPIKTLYFESEGYREKFNVTAQSVTVTYVTDRGAQFSGSWFEQLETRSQPDRESLCSVTNRRIMLSKTTRFGVLSETFPSGPITCNWTLTPQSGMIGRFEVTYNLGEDCASHYINIYMGRSVASTRRLCGSGRLRSTVTPTEGMVRIEYRVSNRNAMIEGAFIINGPTRPPSDVNPPPNVPQEDLVCNAEPQTVYIRVLQIFKFAENDSSEDHLEPANSVRTCTWTFQGTSRVLTSLGLALQTLNRDMQSVSTQMNCATNYIDVYDGNSARTTSLGRACYGNPRSYMFRSTSNMITIRYYADSGSLFKATVFEVPGVPPGPIPTVPPRMGFCDTSNRNLTVDSSARLGVDIASFSSLPINCSWTFNVPQSTNGILTLSYDLGSDCEANNLKLYAGSSPLARSLCNSNRLTLRLSESQPQMRIDYMANSRIARLAGNFIVTRLPPSITTRPPPPSIETVECTPTNRIIMIGQSSSTFVSPVKFAPESAVCSWTFLAPPDMVGTLTLSYIIGDCTTSNYLNLYTTSSMSRRLCGRSSQPLRMSTSSTSPMIHLEYRSNDQNTGIRGTFVLSPSPDVAIQPAQERPGNNVPYAPPPGPNTQGSNVNPFPRAPGSYPYPYPYPAPPSYPVPVPAPAPAPGVAPGQIPALAPAPAIAPVPVAVP